MSRIEALEAKFAQLKEVEGRNGFTLDADGNEVVRDSGYAVAVYEGPLYEITLLIVNNGGYLGFWRDENSGKEYTDLVRIVDDKEIALALGRQFNQEAIYDFANKQSVYV